MRVRNDHWEFMINFAETHPEIITNRCEKENGRQKLNNLWAQLVNELNSMGYGEKSVGDWRKVSLFVFIS